MKAKEEDGRVRIIEAKLMRMRTILKMRMRNTSLKWM
jgi:hypothetical protein